MNTNDSQSIEDLVMLPKYKLKDGKMILGVVLRGNNPAFFDTLKESYETNGAALNIHGEVQGSRSYTRGSPLPIPFTFYVPFDRVTKGVILFIQGGNQWTFIWHRRIVEKFLPYPLIPSEGMGEA